MYKPNNTHNIYLGSVLLFKDKLLLSFLYLSFRASQVYASFFVVFCIIMREQNLAAETHK